MKKDFSISDVVSESFSLMNKNWIPFICVVIIGWIVEMFVSQLFAPTFVFPLGKGFDSIYEMYEEHYLTFVPLQLFNRLIDFVMCAAAARMALDAIDGKKVELDAARMPVAQYVNFVVTCLLVGAIALIGSMFCILPGIFLTVKLTLAPFYTIDKGMSITDALKASWDDTSGNWWQLFGSIIIMVIIVLMGFMLCCVGVVYTACVGYIIEVLLYKVISGGMTDAQAPVSEYGGTDYNKSEYNR